MPVLSPLFASAIEATTTSGTFGAVAETAALPSGDHLVLVTANTLSTNSNSTTAEAEATFGGTRFAFTRYQVGFAGAPDSASGGHIPSAFIATGNGSNTVAVNHRRESGSGTVASTAHIACIPLSSLTEGTHYWVVEGTNTDTLTLPTAGAGWTGSGDQVDVTPGATGEFLVIASGELGFTTGSTATDQARMRCRVTEDPTGTPTSWNLQDNLANAVDGPEVQFEGGDSWDLETGQRFVDVLTLNSGTTYRFEIEREQVTGASNAGYRRERIYIFDLSVWAEFAYQREVTGQNGQDETFSTVATAAPTSAIDYLLLSSIAYQNNNSWIRTHFDQDPAGTPTRLPSSAGFGIGLPDTGNLTTDDYGLIGAQWDRQGVSTAQDYALNCEADITNCRFGAAHGDFPNPNDGVATLTIAWGMETTTAGGGPSLIDGQSDGTSTTTASVIGVAERSATSSGTSTATASPSGTVLAAGTSAGTSTATATVVNGATLAADDASIAFIGNSYMQNFGTLPTVLQHYLDARLTNTTSLGPVPHLGTSIAQRTDGWFTAQTLGGMTLYDDVDQRPSSGTGSTGTTDATDAVGSVANDAYDIIVYTSGFRQETQPGAPESNDDTAVAREVLPGSGGTGSLYEVCLEVARRAVAEVEATGSTARHFIRLTQEGFNANDDANLDDMERTVRLQTLASRQIVAEGVIEYVVPDHYVWSRLQWGAFGSVGSGVTAPVAAYSSLTHTNSSQPGGANLAWLNRSQGDTAPFNTNGHQNVIATIVHAWIWGYALWGIDPRGDTTFDSATGLPSPLDDFINPAGTQIYGGHNTGLGNLPYDTGTNPSGPPDSELDLAWNATVRGQIQDIIVAAVDDWNNAETEFDADYIEGQSDGTSTATASVVGVAARSATSDGSSTATSDVVGVADRNGAAPGSSTATASVVGVAQRSGSSAGTSSATASADIGANESQGSSTATATVIGIASRGGTSAGTSTAAVTASGYSNSAFVTVVSVTMSNPVIRVVV